MIYFVLLFRNEMRNSCKYKSLYCKLLIKQIDAILVDLFYLSHMNKSAQFRSPPEMSIAWPVQNVFVTVIK